MKVTELKEEGLDLHLQVTIDAKVIDDKVSEALLEKSKTVFIKGFRVGNVPVGVVKKKYGAMIRSDIMNSEVEHAVNHIVKDKSLNLASKASVSDLVSEDEQDLKFTVKFELMPKFALPDFKKFTTEKPKLTFTPKDIEEYIDELQESAVTYILKESGVSALKDQVIINAKGYLNGENFPQGNVDNYPLVLGSKSFIPGFEDQLIDRKNDEEVTVKVTFPTNYHEKSLASKDAEFKVKVLQVNSPVKPELNEEFFKKFNCTNLEELKSHIEKFMQNQFADQAKTVMKKNFFDDLEKILDFEVPKSLYDREFSNLKRQSANDDLTPDHSDSESDEALKKITLRRVRIGLLLSEYAKGQNIEVEFEDLKKAVLNQAKSYPGNEKVIIDFYNSNPQAVEGLKGVIIEDKAIDSLFNSELNMIEKDYTLAEFNKILKAYND